MTRVVTGGVVSEGAGVNELMKTSVPDKGVALEILNGTLEFSTANQASGPETAMLLAPPTPGTVTALRNWPCGVYLQTANLLSPLWVLSRPAIRKLPAPPTALPRAAALACPPSAQARSRRA